MHTQIIRAASICYGLNGKLVDKGKEAIELKGSNGVFLY